MRVAVIPARGGSKRIPRKNIRPFGGKPMIAHSIHTARESELFDRIVVSTDDIEIAGIARDAGAEVPFLRPVAIADDHSGTGPVVAHAIEFLRAGGAQLEAVCCVYATAPFMRADDLRQGLAMLDGSECDYVFAATTFAYPVFRAFRETDKKGLEMLFPNQYEMRSQDLPEAFHDAGQFYWGRPQAWLEQRRVFGSSSAIVRIPRWRVQDIDTEEDWARAEIISRYLTAT